METQLSIPASPASWIAIQFQFNIASNLIKTNKQTHICYKQTPTFLDISVFPTIFYSKTGNMYFKYFPNKWYGMLHTVQVLIYCRYECIAPNCSSCFVKYIQQWKTFPRRFASSTMRHLEKTDKDKFGLHVEWGMYYTEMEKNKFYHTILMVKNW